MTYLDFDGGGNSSFWWEEYDANSTGEDIDWSIWPPGSAWFKGWFKEALNTFLTAKSSCRTQYYHCGNFLGFFKQRNRPVV